MTHKQNPMTAAIFDVDRTLLPDRTMERLFLRYLIKNRWLRIADLMRFALSAVRGVISRGGDFQAWYQNKQHFKGKDPAEMDRMAKACFESVISPLISHAGREAVKEHRRAGHLVVLLTGSLEPLANQLAKDLKADVFLAAKLAEEQGALSGHLANLRPYGPEKARLVRELAKSRGLDLEASYAYGDHHSDAEVLSVVGKPHAVNPDAELAREADRRGWPILRF